MRLRDYHPSDFESIWALDQECFPAGIAYARSELRGMLSRKTAETLVAEHDGRVAAFVLGWRERGHDGHVVTLDVAAPARRRGLGRRLLAALERRLGAAGATGVTLEVAAANRTAIAFYERLGYRKAGRLADYYGPGLHAWTMAKALGAPVTRRRGAWRPDRPAPAPAARRPRPRRAGPSR